LLDISVQPVIFHNRYNIIVYLWNKETLGTNPNCFRFIWLTPFQTIRRYGAYISRFLSTGMLIYLSYIWNASKTKVWGMFPHLGHSKVRLFSLSTPNRQDYSDGSELWWTYSPNSMDGYSRLPCRLWRERTLNPTGHYHYFFMWLHLYLYECVCACARVCGHVCVCANSSSLLLITSTNLLVACFSEWGQHDITIATFHQRTKTSHKTS
jgi:hypothetical protein